MALRDHSLDGKITASAMQEFLEKGYMGASLRKIAERAGVTVGAIQTRYKMRRFKAPGQTIIPARERIFWRASGVRCGMSPRRSCT